MLVRSRRVNQCLVIDSDIVVRVIEIKGDSVRLGIDAPIEIPPTRKEVFNVLSGKNKRVGMSQIKEFRFNLYLGEFRDAYDIFYNNRDLFCNNQDLYTSDEIDVMVSGYQYQMDAGISGPQRGIEGWKNFLEDRRC